MKIRPALVATFLVLAGVAHAHPGHDGGHDFEWDFSAVMTHTSLGWALAAFACGLAVSAVRPDWARAVADWSRRRSDR